MRTRRCIGAEKFFLHWNGRTFNTQNHENYYRAVNFLSPFIHIEYIHRFIHSDLILHERTTYKNYHFVKNVSDFFFLNVFRSSIAENM